MTKTTTFELTVVICSHNPRLHILLRTLEALKMQTLARDRWSLLVIDNSSTVPISGLVDLAWHGHARVVNEPTLGLTIARLRGIREAQSDLLIFVDDDNLLDPNYLETAIKIKQDYPNLGAWGGSSIGEFECVPLPETLPYLDYLALRKVTACVWSNLRSIHVSTPIGAGLCIRKVVGEAYAKAVETSPERKSLDRAGTSLASAGDIDLALTACDIGLGTGLFPSLQLTHVIPPERLQVEYLLRLIEGISFSNFLLKCLREQGAGDRLSYGPGDFIRRLFSLARVFTENSLWQWMTFGQRARVARRRGERRALLVLRNSRSAHTG